MKAVKEAGRGEKTRQRIVGAASREFRRRGIDGIGVADIMGQVGLTHGGFYNHFSSKEDLVRVALETCGREGCERLRRRADEGKGLEGIIRGYLQAEHRDHPETGCVAACLAADVGRQPRETRRRITPVLGEMVSIIAEHLPPSFRGGEREATALAIFSLMIGALQMARAVADPALSDRIRESAIRTACALGVRPLSA